MQKYIVGTNLTLKFITVMFKRQLYNAILENDAHCVTGYQVQGHPPSAQGNAPNGTSLTICLLLLLALFCMEKEKQRGE